MWFLMIFSMLRKINFSDIMKSASVLLILLLLIPFSRATIVLDNFESKYNLGDEFDSELDFVLLESRDVEGSLSFELRCHDSSYQIFNLHSQIYAGEKTEINSPFPVILSRYLVENYNLTGFCYVEVVLKDFKGIKIDSAVSNRFLITDKIDVMLILEKDEFLPGERLIIEGIAIKSNGDEAKGTSVLILGKEYTSDIRRGKFSFKLALNESIKSGNNTIKIAVSDNDGNKGEAMKEIIIIPILTSISLEIIKDSIMPGETLMLKPGLYDQANDETYGYIDIIIYSPNNKEVLNKKMSSGEEFGYSLSNKAIPGEWKIKAIADKNIETNKIFQVMKNRAIKAEIYQISGETAFNITNIGNVPYQEDMTIFFETENSVIEKTKKLSLDIDESAYFKLSAPMGDYEISIKSGDFSKTFMNISMTGESVRISGIPGKERKALVRNIILILSLSSILFLLGTKYLRERYYRKKMSSRKSNTLERYMSDLEGYSDPLDLDWKDERFN